MMGDELKWLLKKEGGCSYYRKFSHFLRNVPTSQLASLALVMYVTYACSNSAMSLLSCAYAITANDVCLHWFVPLGSSCTVLLLFFGASCLT